MNNSEPPNALEMLLQVLYDVAETMTGIIGLTPLQFVIVCGCAFLCLVAYQIYCATRGKMSFSLEDGENAQNRS